jgi:NadR type nicotinamide-nucleotide adenylyltransferase
MLKRIVTIGPESTGKSSLCKQLAEHYNTLWCPEYAREYLTIHGMNYTYDDLLTVAKGQLDLEEKYTQLATGPATRREQFANGNEGDSDSSLITHHSLLFIDTDMYVMKVWCEFVFGKCHQFILDQIEKRKYDLYLLCNIDLPWVHDELREYPHEGPRQELYEIYKNIMQNQSTPWAEINGNHKQRLQKAIDAVDNILKK